MSFRRIILVLAILVFTAAVVGAQGIECPDVEFETEVTSRRITLRWEDAPFEQLTAVDISLKKVTNFLFTIVDGDTIRGDSLSWRGTALPTISGTYQGNCDFLYRFAKEEPTPPEPPKAEPEPEPATAG